jgi:Skp family chaperone for outer membrane proteins
MSTTFTRGAALALLTLLISASSFAAGPPPTPAAAPAPGVSVIVIDRHRVLTESKVGKTINAQLQAKATSYDKSFAQEEQELISQQQELQRQQTILAQDAFAAKAKDFEQKVTDGRRKVQASKIELQRGQNSAETAVMREILQILSDIAKERSANLVLDSAVVVMFDNAYDVTDEVIKRLDERLPTFTVSFAPVDPNTIGAGPDGTAPAAPKTAAKKPAAKKP